MLEPIFLSLKVALISVFLVFITGTTLARFMSRHTFYGQEVMETLLTLPLVLPPSVLGFGLLMIFGRHGPIGRLLDYFWNTQIVFTWWAAVIASTIVAFPLMYQSAKAAFRSIDVRYEQAARTLGAWEWRIFTTITLPLAWPGLLAGLVLSFARSLGEFGATLMLAGNIPGRTQTVPLAIYFAVESGNEQEAYLMVFIMTALSFCIILWLNFWIRKKGTYRGEGN